MEFHNFGINTVYTVYPVLHSLFCNRKKSVFAQAPQANIHFIKYILHFIAVITTDCIIEKAH